ncbi:IS200/IS605 family transposase [Ancylomarina euxinus]|uniref:IS200/IS605 family transposase n=1 Tax=Ancylomarina euxinus TaxID=2283627 RepID=A0A425XWZ1_9BACT|nr:IS200/IS605 family transposase [Ancylomarina euxinus]MCZ4696280.1 IS200/IS605 family transposase [Ancylomarina euxinus]MUP16690.1 IS200/IS605 family transposase [Ancylomarina euxinus]RRG19154.1 IS200/IS605 family transposase [Ancylomarina euxinus]
MGQSLSQLYVHLTFGTKFREPYIRSEIEKELHAYIIGILRKMESPSLRVNSMPDHIHILFRLSKNYALAKVVEEVKKSSSKWMKEKGVKEFTWQIGYGAFSVSSRALHIVESYIEHQKEHHKSKTYKSELESYIKESDVVEYDEKYFWT